MEHNLHVPAILFACANSYDDAKRLKNLVKERDELVALFEKNIHSTGYQILCERSEEGIYLPDLLKENAFNPTVQVLHISGYSKGKYLNIQGKMGEESISVKTFSEWIGKLPGLQVVFLNGCATEEFLEALIHKDIPAVIVTRAGDDRRELEPIAKTFYKALAAGKSIKESVKAVHAKFPSSFVWKEVKYDFELDSLIWIGKEETYERKFRKRVFSGIYTLPENAARLDWKLPPKPEGFITETPKKKNISSKKKITLIGSGIVVAALITLGLVIFQFPHLLGSGESDIQACLFPESESYNILQLPFFEKGNCGTTESFYRDAIQRRLSIFADLEETINYRPLKKIACPVPYEVAGELAQSCNADLILWGTYEVEERNKSVVLNFSYLYSSLPLKVNQGDMMLQMPIHLFEAENDFIVSAVEDVVSWAIGMGHFERKEYEQAAKYLSQMQVREDKSYRVVDQRLAESYKELQDWEMALEYYNHLLSIDPENYAAYNERGNLYIRLHDYKKAETDFNDATRIQPEVATAYFNRGMLFLKQGAYINALADVEKVLKYKPSAAGKAYALQAAIYAEMKETTLFYSNFERALQKGFRPDDSKPYATSFQAYQGDTQYLELISKYN